MKAVTGNLARLFAVMLSVLMLSGPVSAETEETFKRIPMQYIAALADPGAVSGTGAENWGLWREDPGPRGVYLKRIGKLKAAGGVAPAKWTFDQDDWWLDENGLLMEKPDFDLPPGKYLVTGDREAVSVLTVEPKDSEGRMRWSLGYGTQLYDVTHLPCRSARYRPATSRAKCTPETVRDGAFPVTPGHPMPVVGGCEKKDYAVLFVFGLATGKVASKSDMAACAAYGTDRLGTRGLEKSDGSIVICPSPKHTARSQGTPYLLRNADLRSLEDPSQRPRCNAKESIAATCGTKAYCQLPVSDDLCNEADVAKYTTHAQVEWKCRGDEAWRFSRAERGKSLVIDCRP